MSESAPWLRIWTSPRTTIRHIVESDSASDTHAVVLSALAGALWGYHQFSAGKSPVALRPEFWFASAIVSVAINAVVNVGFLYIAGLILAGFGRLLGGAASARDVRAAIAWSQVPLIFMGALGFAIDLPFLLLFGDPSSDRYQTGVGQALAHVSLSLVLYGGASLVLLLFLFYLIILVATVAEVHRFSLWKAGATSAIGLVLSAVAFWFLVFYFYINTPIVLLRALGL